MQENGISKNDDEDRSLNGTEMSMAQCNLWFPSMDSSMCSIDEKAFRMMEKMGYKPGSGLGKDEQGITTSIEVNVNLGKRGLGLKLNNLNLSDQSWDFSQEDVLVNEKVQWLENQSNHHQHLVEENFKNWTKEGPPNNDIVGDPTFCDQEVLQNVFKAKEIFDELGVTELNQARARANPFEKIRSVFFMNRAALKMANLDAACDFMFTTLEDHENSNNNNSKRKSPIYFADVCAGPGGFSEYILWRKQWLYKGFGLTLKGEHDFKVSDSNCASSATFQALYGADENGDVCNLENLKDFTDRVRNETDGRGVHFMMSDGGFCVDGQENLQEVLSKNIYVCQCLLALNILRPHGHFVTKTFDVFTPFSVGLLYLMHLCFEKVGIIKPNSSRPANSERYFVCNNFKVNPRTNIIRDYLWKTALRLWELKTLPDRDIVEIVPLKVLKEDQVFFQYIKDSNTSIGKRQIVALKKLAMFCRNPALAEARQGDLRKQCLEYWNIPDNKRKTPEIFKVENVLEQACLDGGVLAIRQLKYMHSLKKLKSTILDLKDWYYTFLYSTKAVNRTNFYAGVGLSKTYRLQNNRWVKIKHLELVKGTLLYGEFVKETSVLEDNCEIVTRYSLHVIDALFLGNMDVRRYTYEERLNFINIFCKAVNKESQTKYSLRVRAKTMKRLAELPQDFSLVQEMDVENLSATLPTIGYKSIGDKYDVNSVLLVKTNDFHCYDWMNNMFAMHLKDQSGVILGISLGELTETVHSLLI